MSAEQASVGTYPPMLCLACGINTVQERRRHKTKAAPPSSAMPPSAVTAAGVVHDGSDGETRFSAPPGWESSLTGGGSTGTSVSGSVPTTGEPGSSSPAGGGNGVVLGGGGTGSPPEAEPGAVDAAGQVTQWKLPR